MTSELKEEFYRYLEEFSPQSETPALPGYLSGFQLVSCLHDNPQKKTFLFQKPDGGKLIGKYACGEYQMMLKTEDEISRLKKFPFLPYVIDYRESESGAFLLREYIEGQTLSEWIADKGPRPLDEALPVIRNLCRSLSLLHHTTPPLIYRDIKPSNIILTQDGDCYIIDTGTMRRYQESESSDTFCMGTAGFAAPEQFGARQSDARTDIYGLGILFYYLLTGESKMEDASLLKLPGKVSLLIQKCTEFNPNMRYQNTEDLESALEELIAPPIPKKRKVWAVTAGVSLFAVFLCLLTAGLLYFHQKKSITFSSPLLEQAVREELGKSAEEPVYAEDLKRITKLYICGNRIFHSLKEHEEANIDLHWAFGYSGTPIDGVGDIQDLSLLKKMPNLRSLVLDSQRIYDLTPLKGLQLTHLSLAGNPISDLSPLSGCTSLYTLDISHTGVHSLEALSECKGLTALNCSYTSVSELAPLANLNLITLTMREIPAQDYETLEKLHIINLRCYKLSPEALPHLQKMDSLQELEFYDSRIESLQQFAGFSSLSALGLSKCSLQSLEGIEYLPSLKSLDIMYTPVSDGSRLSSVQTLQYLSVLHTGITDFSFLNRMPCLTDITISKTQLPYLKKAVSEPWFNINQLD